MHGTVPGGATVASADTYTLRREIRPSCPLCSPWTPAECQACGLQGGSLTTLLSELPPDVPIVSMTAVTNTSLTGTISACTRGGVAYPTCIQQVRLVPNGQSCTADPIAFSPALTAAAQSWTISGLVAAPREHGAGDD